MPKPPFEKKYFFFDIDGTLTEPGTGRIPDDTAKTIAALQKAGHFVAVATGRLQASSLPICHAMGIDNIVSDGGNGITIDGQLVELVPLEKALCARLIEEAEQKGYLWAISTENSSRRFCKEQAYADIAKSGYAEHVVMPDLDYKTQPAIYKVFIACTAEQEKELASLQGQPVLRFNDSYLVVEPDDKALGIRRMLGHFGAAEKDVVVFGDGTNDIKMFDPAWFSVAMGNAHPLLKERANYVTDDFDKDGIGKACRHFTWIPEEMEVE